MKSKEIFHLAVRLLGLVFVYHGFMSIPMIFTVAWPSLAFVVCYLAAAWWLLTTQWLTNRVFPDAVREEKKSDEVAAGIGKKAEAQ
jgi:protein-S-isoprenylcysteine O-methyltransferase Ste14